MKRLLVYFIVRALLVGLELIPYRTMLQFARLMGRFASWFPSTASRRCLRYLKRAYGDEIDEKRLEEIARGAFDTLALHVAEFTQMRRRATYKLTIENGEGLKEAHKQGRGVLLVSAHLGCFIRMITIPKVLGVRASVVMNENRNQRLHRWMISTLKRTFNLDVILKTKARQEVVERLRDGHLVALFADHPVREGGFPARFFGQPTPASSGPAVYAKRLGCPLFILTAILKPDGSHVLRFTGPISTDGSHEEITQRWISELEARIRENPDQWTWMRKGTIVTPGTARIRLYSALQEERCREPGYGS